MNLAQKCPDCHATISAHVFAIGQLDEKRIAQLILAEHRKDCLKGDADET